MGPLQVHLEDMCVGYDARHVWPIKATKVTVTVWVKKNPPIKNSCKVKTQTLKTIIFSSPQYVICNKLGPLHDWTLCAHDLSQSAAPLELLKSVKKWKVYCPLSV